jgi:hypothetical protein
MTTTTTTTKTTKTPKPERRHYATHIADMTDAQRVEDIADLNALIGWFLANNMLNSCTNCYRIRSAHERALGLLAD